MMRVKGLKLLMKALGVHLSDVHNRHAKMDTYCLSKAGSYYAIRGKRGFSMNPLEKSMKTTRM